MGIRPRTARAKRNKSRRCVKCGKHLNSLRKRCKTCHAVALNVR